MNIRETRKYFPVTQGNVYLNNAGETPLNTRVQERLEMYLKTAAENPQNKPSVRGEVKELLSKLLGGRPDEYALVTSTGVGISTVAAGFKWKTGDNVVVPYDEHWNNAFPWLALRDRGVEVRFVRVGADNRIRPEDVAAQVDHKTRILAVAAVRFNSGFRSDLKRLSEIAHGVGALFLVDGIQAAGVIPMNVEDDGIDILCGAGFKWLLGLHGTGYMYVRSGAQDLIAPVLPGMFAAEDNFRELNYHKDARRFETGTIAYSLFHAWTAGLELLLEIGVDKINCRVMGLTDQIIEGLQKKGIQILSPVENMQERSSVLVFSVGSEEANKALYTHLKQKNIITTLRGGVLRVSPSFFNTEDEIAAFLKEL